MAFCRRNAATGYLLLVGIRSPERAGEMRRIALSAPDENLRAAARNLALGFQFDVLAVERAT